MLAQQHTKKLPEKSRTFYEHSILYDAKWLTDPKAYTIKSVIIVINEWSNVIIKTSKLKQWQYDGFKSRWLMSCTFAFTFAFASTKPANDLKERKLIAICHATFTDSPLSLERRHKFTMKTKAICSILISLPDSSLCRRALCERLLHTLEFLFGIKVLYQTLAVLNWISARNSEILALCFNYKDSCCFNVYYGMPILLLPLIRLLRFFISFDSPSSVNEIFISSTHINNMSATQSHICFVSSQFSRRRVPPAILLSGAQPSVQLLNWVD